MTQITNSGRIEPPPQEPLVSTEVEVEGRSIEAKTLIGRAWDNWFKLVRDRLIIINRYEVAIDVTSVAANTTAEQPFTVTGLTTRDTVYVNKPSHNAGLGIVNCRVSAANTLAITFMNATGSGIDPGSETYFIVAVRM